MLRLKTRAKTKTGQAVSEWIILLAIVSFVGIAVIYALRDSLIEGMNRIVAKFKTEVDSSVNYK